jgi:hypothetical protein
MELFAEVELKSETWKKDAFLRKVSDLKNLTLESGNSAWIKGLYYALDKAPTDGTVNVIVNPATVIHKDFKTYIVPVMALATAKRIKVHAVR